MKPLPIAIWAVLLTSILIPNVLAADLPPPLRVYIPYEAAWEGMLEVLGEEKWKILYQDRGKGTIVTQYREYSSGPLTENHIAKIGERPKLLDATWQEVEYQYEVVTELIEARETLITVNANIRALKRDFFGQTSWVDIPTNGQREEWLLTQFGQHLFGASFELDKPKKGFWERSPKYVPNPLERMPKVAGPERP